MSFKPATPCSGTVRELSFGCDGVKGSCKWDCLFNMLIVDGCKKLASRFTSWFVWTVAYAARSCSSFCSFRTSFASSLYIGEQKGTAGACASTDGLAPMGPMPPPVRQRWLHRGPAIVVATSSALSLNANPSPYIVTDAIISLRTLASWAFWIDVMLGSSAGDSSAFLPLFSIVLSSLPVV